jgi:hypothetical protein
MTKRKGLLDVDVDARKLLEEQPTGLSTDPKERPMVINGSMLITTALDVITR